MKYFLTGLLFILSFSMIKAQSASDIWLFKVKRNGTVKFYRKITQTNQYENQPMIHEGIVYWTSMQEDGSMEIRAHNIKGNSSTNFTDTPESEYSASPTPDGKSITVVRGAEQQLWNFPLNGTDPQMVMPVEGKVGYYTWFGGNQLAMFVLGEPSQLMIADVSQQKVFKAGENVGRSFHQMPGNEQMFTFIQQGETSRIMSYEAGTFREIAILPENTQDFAWSSMNRLYTGVGSQFFMHDSSNNTWRPILDLAKEGVVDITRISFSADGKYMAAAVTLSK